MVSDHFFERLQTKYEKCLGYLWHMGLRPVAQDREERTEGEQAEHRTFLRSWGKMGRGDPKGRHKQGRLSSLSGKNVRCRGRPTPLSQTLKHLYQGTRLICSQQTS